MFELRLNQGAVLLRKAVAPLVDLANYADVEITPEEVIVLTSGNPTISEVLALLRIPDSTFVHLRCDDPRSFVLNLGGLYFNLNRSGDDDELTIHGDDGDDLIGFVTVNSSQYHISNFVFLSAFLGVFA
jgi:hypothetical protein